MSKQHGRGTDSALRIRIQELRNRLSSLLTKTDNLTTIMSGVATEATQLDVLAAIDAMRDYEVRLVVDNSDVTWLEVRYWDAQDGSLGAPVYYPPGSTTPGTPDTGGSGLSYINPNTFLAQLVTNTTGINLETTQQLIKTAIDGINTSTGVIKGGIGTEDVAHGASQTGMRAFGSDGTNDQQLKTDADGELQIDVLSSALPTGAATEATLTTLATQATLQALLTAFNAEDFATAANQVLILNGIASLNASKTATSVVTTGTHNVPVGATEVSIFNNGTGDATVNGTKIPAGVTRTFGFKNPLAAIIACDGGGTEELIIDYMV